MDYFTEVNDFSKTIKYISKISTLFVSKMWFKIEYDKVYIMIALRTLLIQNELMSDELFEKLDLLIQLTLNENRFRKIIINIDPGNNDRNNISKTLTYLDKKYIRKTVSNNIILKITLY